jgi:putative copper export protein
MSWILALSYWIHLLATVIWLGGITLLTLFAWPALKRGTLDQNQWWSTQRKFVLWANISIVALLISGFYQMTNDINYSGFLTIDSQWAVTMLLKHIAFVVMVGITVYMQAVLYPAMSRVQLLNKQKPAMADAEREKLQKREIQMLRLNLVCALVVLLLTAVATAI